MRDGKNFNFRGKIKEKTMASNNNK